MIKCLLEKNPTEPHHKTLPRNPMPYFKCPKTNKTECGVRVVATDLDSCGMTINRISSRSSPRQGKGWSQRWSGEKMEDGGTKRVLVPFNRVAILLQIGPTSQRCHISSLVHLILPACQNYLSKPL